MSKYVIRNIPLSNKNIYSVEMLNGIEIIKEDIKEQQDSEIRKILIYKSNQLWSEISELQKKINSDLAKGYSVREPLSQKNIYDMESSKLSKKLEKYNMIIQNLEIFEKKYNDFLMMETTMGILGKMQRTIINKTEKIFEVIYLSNNTVNIYEGIPELQKSRTDRYLNEYTFLPFVKKDGYIDREKPVLREEYKISLFKTLLILYKLDSSGKNFKNYLEAKYNPEILPEYQGEIFQGCLFLKMQILIRNFLIK